jgi:hypothetical protein
VRKPSAANFAEFELILILAPTSFNFADGRHTFVIFGVAKFDLCSEAQQIIASDGEDTPSMIIY